MARAGRRLALTVALRREIEDLHRFFEQWFRGELPGDPATFARVEEALEPEFEIVSPRGIATARDALLEELFAAHGSRRNEPFRIWVRGVRIHAEDGSSVLATYEEWQETSPGITARLSSAWLRFREDGRMTWVHVHETWVPGRAPRER